VSKYLYYSHLHHIFRNPPVVYIYFGKGGGSTFLVKTPLNLFAGNLLEVEIFGLYSILCIFFEALLLSFTPGGPICPSVYAEDDAHTELNEHKKRADCSAHPSFFFQRME